MAEFFSVPVIATLLQSISPSHILPIAAHAFPVRRNSADGLRSLKYNAMIIEFPALCQENKAFLNHEL
jgi:hypothetical protein